MAEFLKIHRLRSDILMLLEERRTASCSLSDKLFEDGSPEIRQCQFSILWCFPLLWLLPQCHPYSIVWWINGHWTKIQIKLWNFSPESFLFNLWKWDKNWTVRFYLLWCFIRLAGIKLPVSQMGLMSSIVIWLIGISTNITSNLWNFRETLLACEAKCVQV